MDKYGMFHLKGFYDILQEFSNVSSKQNYSPSGTLGDFGEMLFYHQHPYVW